MRKTFFILAIAWAAAALAQPAPQTDQAPPKVERKVPSAAAGGTVQERRDPAEAQRLFRELDRNRDGYLSDGELWARQGRDANWAAVDRNGDGRITPEEFTVLRR
jgi:hypothetical protein